MTLLRIARAPLVILYLLLASLPLRAAERGKVEAFLNVTGFDVALDSIRFAAAGAPQMLGLEPDRFGSDWTRLSREVFDPAIMQELALDILEKTLSEDDLTHAAEFYASPLGQRLVEVENAAHMMEDDTEKDAEGARLVAEMVETGSDRLELLKRMNRAVDVSDSSLRALQEVRIRFLLAASASGVIDLRIDPGELRALMESQERGLRIALQQSALANAAYTYREFSDDDMRAYTEALEAEPMQRVYELLNAVQYEIMANRFEVLARRMTELHPQQDI